MGTKQYATKIAELIDSDNVFFKEHRIISRDDCVGKPISPSQISSSTPDVDFSYKNLKRLFPCDDTMVLIVDDREDVWSDARNLIKIEPCIQEHNYYYYSYFIISLF